MVAEGVKKQFSLVKRSVLGNRKASSSWSTSSQWSRLLSSQGDGGRYSPDPLMVDSLNTSLMEFSRNANVIDFGFLLAIFAFSSIMGLGDVESTSGAVLLLLWNNRAGRLKRDLYLAGAAAAASAMVPCCGCWGAIARAVDMMIKKVKSSERRGGSTCYCWLALLSAFLSLRKERFWGVVTKQRHSSNELFTWIWIAWYTVCPELCSCTTTLVDQSDKDGEEKLTGSSRIWVTHPFQCFS